MHLKLGGTFPEEKRGILTGTSLFNAKSWGHVPPVPSVSTSNPVSLCSHR